MKRVCSWLSAVIMVGMIVSLPVRAVSATLFYEDFEGDLSQWYGKGGGTSYNSVIMPDPVESDYALTFEDINSAGDIFTVDTFTTSSKFVLSFDYLSTCGTADCGGYIGFSTDTPGPHGWFASLGDTAGMWQHFTIEFLPGDAYALVNGVSSPISYFFGTVSATDPIHIMVEDFFSPVGDAYFDNILLTDGSPTSPVPEPATFLLLGSGLAGLMRLRKRSC